MTDLICRTCYDNFDEFHELEIVEWSGENTVVRCSNCGEEFLFIRETGELKKIK